MKFAREFLASFPVSAAQKTPAVANPKTRKPTPVEKNAALKEVRLDGNAGFGNVIWALLNTREFLFIQ